MIQKISIKEYHENLSNDIYSHNQHFQMRIKDINNRHFILQNISQQFLFKIYNQIQLRIHI